MDIMVNGKNLDVGEALRVRVADALNGVVSKSFTRAVDGTVTLSREARLFRADISVRAGRGVVLKSGGTGTDAYAAFDSALTRISKQLRRYKKRLVDHQKRRPAEETTRVQQYIIAAESEDEAAEEEEGQPAVIAELPTEVAMLTVSEAVMHMDLADLPVVMFRNRAHGGLNVVYRRPDGNIGWIDPNNTLQAEE